MRGCSGGGHAWLLQGGHAWLLLGGACMVAPGGACVVALGGHVWLLRGGGMRGCSGGGVRGCSGGVRGFFDEIRSMSGRYASYWNAFLFSFAYLNFVGVYTCVAWWQTQDAEDVAVVGTKVCTTRVHVPIVSIHVEFSPC